MSRRGNTTSNKGSAKIPSPINRLLQGNSFLTSLTGGSNGASSLPTTSNNSNSAAAMMSNGGASASESMSFLNTIDNEKVDKKLFDKTCKLIEKCLRQCQQEKLNLINSPPYIIDILPDIHNHLNHISASYENKMHILNEIEYFVVFMNNLFYKCEKVLKLFRDAGKKMFEETSNERKELIKYSLVFSHMLAELKSLFPNYIYEGLNFRIAKADAAEFWKNNFNEKIIIPWGEFHSRLNNTHQIHSEESEQLRKTIQLTGTKYVSIFEFDIFTRLFQPWNTLLNNWKLLAIVHPAYGAFMTYDEVVKRLQNYIDKPGSYLFRLSCTKLGQWAIGYVTGDKKILQTIPQSLAQALIDGQKQGIYLYPDGRDIHIDLGQLAVASAERIKISREQYDMYCDMGTSFQLCKICSENNKDRKLEPCGHLICSRCLENWQEKNTVTASCPFCRCEIKAFEPIVISPFENPANEVKRHSSINGVSNLSRKTNKNNSNKNETDDSDQDSLHFSSSLGQKSKISDILLLPGSPPPPPPSALPIPPLPARSNSNIHKKSNNNFSDTDFEQEDYLKPSLKLNGSNSMDNLIGSHDIATTSNAVAGASGISSSSSNTNFPPKNNRNSMQIPTSSSINTVLNVPPLPPPPPPPPVPPLPSPPSPSSILQMPTSIPPPTPASVPPPVPPVSSLISHIQATNTEQAMIKFKIENERLLNHLVKLGFDRTKSACALLITNNNLDHSLEILNKYTTK